jgi:alkyldihydroxyacetonephosphate synthase
MSAARLKHFGWGREGEGLTAEEEAFVVTRAEARFGMALKESASAPRLRMVARSRLMPLCSERRSKQRRIHPSSGQKPQDQHRGGEPHR